MGTNPEDGRTQSRVEMVVRTLRHEVGDLLQSVYSAVAILQERLPRGQTLERTILSDLRSRAESCKHELDAIHDLVCPLTLNLDWIELSELASRLAAGFALRYPGLQIVCEAPRPVKAWGDAPRLLLAGNLLMLSLCQAARSKIVLRVQAANGFAEWSFTQDGPAATDEQLSWMNAPFSTTRHARFGLGLAFPQRVLTSQGGQVTTAEIPGEGFRITLSIPAEPPPS